MVFSLCRELNGLTLYSNKNKKNETAAASMLLNAEMFQGPNATTTVVAHLLRRVRALEREPTMQKERLVRLVLGDPTIHWDEIYRVLALKHRHRGKTRWRRLLVAAAVQRRFPNGRQPRPPCRADDDGAALAALGAFDPETVWERFRCTFPVLAVYRAVWSPASPIAAAPPVGGGATAAWNRLCHAIRSAGHVDLATVADELGWPRRIADEAQRLRPDALTTMARSLWPEQRWTTWLTAGGCGVTDAAALPYLRRAACLLHGFALGGGSARAVTAAMRLPHRSGTVTTPPCEGTYTVDIA